MGFHVDTSGNIWSGTNVGDTFSSASPTFYVTDAGFLYAVDGELGGISITADGIEGSFTSTTGFQINSAGDATFRDVTVRGTIEATNLTDDMTMNGGKIKTSSSGSRVEIFDSSNVGVINFIDSDGSTLMSMQAGADEFIMVGGTDDNVKITTVQGKEFMVAGGSIVLESDTSLKFDLGGPIYLGVDPGTSGEVLTSAGPNAAPSWQTSSAHSHNAYNFPNSGTLLSDDTHSHNSTNTVLNTNTSFTGMINHIAESVGNSGSAHGLTLADVTTLGNTNVLTDANHAHSATNINAITSNYNNNVTAYNTAFSAAGAFNLYNTINSALNNKANNSALHNNHDYFTNADVDGSHHSHNGYLTGNESHFNSASAHGQYVYYNDYLNHISNFNSHKNSNNSHSAAIAAAVNSHYNAYISGHLSSDRRFKTNIIDTNLGLEFINRLQPREFDWTSDYLDDLLDSNDQHAIVARDIYTNIQQGFIVDEVKDAVFEQTGSNNAFSGLTFNPRNKDELDTLDEANPVGYIRPTDFIPPLVKAVQELSAKIELLEARIDELEGV